MRKISIYIFLLLVLSFEVASSLEGVRLIFEKNITVNMGTSYYVNISFLRNETEDSHSQIFYTTDIAVI